MDEVKNLGYSKLLRGMSIDDEYSKNNSLSFDKPKQSAIESKFITDKKSDTSRSVSSKLSVSGK